MPKNHFSWSQLNLWETSKKAYVDRYIYEIPMFETKALLYGKAFADAMEAGKSDDPVLDSMVKMIPKGVLQEHKVEAEFEGINLLGFEDSSEVGGFIEYKTGSKEWTQERADNHGQLHFYSLIRLLNGKPMPKVRLIWLPTEDTQLTMEIKEFKVKVTDKHIENIEKRIRKAIKEIKEYKLKGSITI